MVTIARPNEVSLYGNYYPTIGPVTRGDAAQWSPRQTFGDATKDSEKLSSSVTWGDQRGGIGIKFMDETKDADRYDWGYCETGFNGYISLPALYSLATKPGGADNAVILIEYANELYAAFGTALYKWDAAWTDLTKTLTAAPTDAIVFNGKLYFACGTDFDRYDGTTLTTGTALSVGAATPQPTRFFVEWNDCLFIISNAGQLSYTTAASEGVAWTTNALSLLPAGSFNSLFTYRDGAGAIVPHLGTTVGLYYLDYANSKWIETELKFPEHADACKGACVWRGAAYIPVGTGVYEYKIDSSVAVVTPMGPDRDNGLPQRWEGNIVKLIGEHNYLYAFISESQAGYSMVLKWNGKGWHPEFESGGQNKIIDAAAINTADSTYRLWISTNDTVQYRNLPVDLLNPAERTGSTYSGVASTHYYPWFDANNAAIDKLALGVTIYVTGVSATEFAKLYYYLDYNESSSTLLLNTLFPDGQIDSVGGATFAEATFTFASAAGLAFKALRFGFVLDRGATTTVTPVVRWLRLNYQKLLTPQYSFSIVVDCTHDYRHLRASTLEAALITAYETDTLGAFVFRTSYGVAESHQVKVMSIKEVTKGGRRQAGQYQVGLVTL